METLGGRVPLPSN